MIFCNPDEVAVEPLKEENTQINSSIASLASRGDNLKPLKVLFTNESVGVLPGDFVYLRPEAYTASFMSHKYSVNGTKFVLIPKSMVILSDKAAY